MHFEANHIYHVYNRGNNKTPIFFNPENYLFILRKVRNEWLRYCDIFCYCLMPNHFHFMLSAKPGGCENLILGNRCTHLQKLSKAIGKTLSSYTQAINIQNKTTGNLFQKKTKAKCLTEMPIDIICSPMSEYLLHCFHYIHLNPLKANLVTDLSGWPYSSWLDYFGGRNGTLCNKKKAMEVLRLLPMDPANQENFIFNPELLAKLW